jgi:hypothetical protein
MEFKLNRLTRQLDYNNFQMGVHSDVGRVSPYHGHKKKQVSG